MTATVKFRTTPVFDWNYNSQARIRINQGGTSSGKTYAILQVIFLLLIEKKRIATIVGQDIPNLKAGVIRDLQERILVDIPWMNAYIESYNKTDRVYRFKNGSILEFNSYDDAQDARQGKRDIAFFNEANGIPFSIYQQVAMRTNETIFIDYNPDAEFWVHDRVQIDPKAVTFYSNFTHNEHVNEHVVEYLRSLKGVDEEAWKVYGLGKTGSVTELVYPNVTIVEQMPDNLKFRGYGLDFGYRADPTTLIECGLQNQRDLYFDEIFYRYNLKTSAINDLFVEHDVKRQLTIWADSAEVRVIDDLCDDYNWNVQGADKGPGSVLYGVNLMNDHAIHITQRSANMIKERRRYKHKVTKDGFITNEVVKAFDHTFDAARYWAMMNVKPIARKTAGRSGVRRRN